MTRTSSVMVSSEEATRGRAVLQALRERDIRQERHGERPPAVPLQGLRTHLHGDPGARQAAGDEGAGGPALRPGQRQPGHDRQAARGGPRRRLQVGPGGRRGYPGAFGHSLGRHRADRRDVALRGREKTRWLLSGFGVLGIAYATKPAIRVPSSAFPRHLALCTSWKKPRYAGSFSCETPRCGRSQERSSDQKPSAVLTCTSQNPSPSSSRAYSPRAWQTVLGP